MGQDKRDVGIRIAIVFLIALAMLAILAKTCYADDVYHFIDKTDPDGWWIATLTAIAAILRFVSRLLFVISMKIPKTRKIYIIISFVAKLAAGILGYFETRDDEKIGKLHKYPSKSTFLK